MSEFQSSSISPFGYSEEEMAQAFERLLLSENGLPGVGVFNKIYREISCHQGRPDFIALRYSSTSDQYNEVNIPGLVGPTILTILKPMAPRTFEYLTGMMEFGNDNGSAGLHNALDILDQGLEKDADP